MDLAACALGADAEPSLPCRLVVDPIVLDVECDPVDLERRVRADEAEANVPEHRGRFAFERVAVAAAAHEAHVLNVARLQLDRTPEPVLTALARRFLQAPRKLVDVATAERRVADVAAGVAAEETQAHRRARALAEEDQPQRAPRPVRGEGVLVADAATELPRAARVRNGAAVEVHQRRVQLLAFGVRPARDHVRDLAAEVDAVAEGARASGSGERVGERGDEELAVRVDSVRLDMRVAPVPDGGRAVLELLAGAEHLGQHERREVVDDLDRPDGCDRDRGGSHAVDHASLGRDQTDRSGDALVPGHVPGEEGKDRGEHPSPRRPVAAVDAEVDLGARAGEVVGERLAFLRGGQLDLAAAAGHVDVLAGAPAAVREPAQPLSDELLRLPDQLVRHRVHNVRPVLLVMSPHALLRDVVGGELGLQVECRHPGVPDHVEERLDDVAPELPALDDLEALRLEAFLVVVPCVRGEAAGIDRSDVGHVDEVGDEAAQLAFEVDRRDHVHVGRVQRCGVGVVEEVRVVLVDPGVLREVGDDVLHRLGGARQVVQEADAADHQPAVAAVERGHHVVALVRDR